MGTGWRRLGVRIATERTRRGWTVKQLSTIAGVSTRTIESLEAGERSQYRATTLGRIEQSFGWEPESVIRIVEGAQPRLSVDPLMARIHDAWPNVSPDHQVLIVTIVETLGRQL